MAIRIMNCGATDKSACPTDWDDYFRKSRSGTRECPACRRQVIHCQYDVEYQLTRKIGCVAALERPEGTG